MPNNIASSIIHTFDTIYQCWRFINWYYICHFPSEIYDKTGSKTCCNKRANSIYRNKVILDIKVLEKYFHLLFSMYCPCIWFFLNMYWIVFWFNSKFIFENMVPKAHHLIEIINVTFFDWIYFVHVILNLISIKVTFQIYVYYKIKYRHLFGPHQHQQANLEQ